MALKFQKAGYDVIGMDMRAFGQTETQHPGLIDNPDTQQIVDSLTFLKAYRDTHLSDSTSSHPIVFYGYSLGATLSVGTYYRLLAEHPEIAQQVKAMLFVSPQTGMGSFWYPNWYRPRQGRLLSMLNYKWGSFGPLYSMRDRHDPIQYKGDVYAKTLWTVQDWTERNMQKAGEIEIPFHMAMSSKDRVVSPICNRQFFEKVAS